MLRIAPNWLSSRAKLGTECHALCCKGLHIHRSGRSAGGMKPGEIL